MLQAEAIAPHVGLDLDVTLADDTRVVGDEGTDRTRVARGYQEREQYRRYRHFAASEGRGETDQLVLSSSGTGTRRASIQSASMS